MRLSNALQATRHREPTILYSWHSDSAAWIMEPDLSQVGAPRRSSKPRAVDDSKSRIAGVKRRIFPSTLWQAGSQAVAAARPLLAEALRPGDTVVLHTTYLAPLVPELRRGGFRVVVDVYDLVWRAHQMDAASAGRLGAATLEVYARATRRAEMRLLSAASALAVVGWMDLRYIQAHSDTPARWAPVGIPTPTVRARQPTNKLAVGLIGDFAHSATSDAARRLARSPLAQDSAFQLVFAGPGSEKWNQEDGIQGMGEVDDVGSFYSAIDACVVPVANGTGMKCKLAESAMASRACVTTPHGGQGYPPHLAALMTILPNEQALEPGAIREAIEQTDLRQVRAAFIEEVGLDAAAERYLDAVGEAP